MSCARPIRIMPRSWLFVPATRPERFDKAIHSGAEAVIIDLEDAVDVAEKNTARQNIAQFMSQIDNDISHNENKDHNLPSLWVRLNNDHQLKDDINLCNALIKSTRLTGVVLPKVTAATQIEGVFELLKLPIIAQIESAQGIGNLDDIAQSEGVLTISYGRLDICNELNLKAGSKAEQDFFNHLRQKIRITSQRYGLSAPIESVYADFKDTEGMQASTAYAADLGYSGILCIHPSQVAIANKHFKANAGQLDFATKVVAHYQRTGDSIFAIEGVMVDLPVILQCQRLLQ